MGGTVLEGFGAFVDTPRAELPANLLLIAMKNIKTSKYVQALALGVPRLSNRWIDSCYEAHQVLSYQPYLLPTGMSEELETIVSSTPPHNRGIFCGLVIGLCGSFAFKEDTKTTLKLAGAKVKAVTPKSGPQDCNYIIFYNLSSHENYCKVNTPVPKLSHEWLTQCLINQRIVSIYAHPSYREFKNYSIPTA
ncbi:hypothetical protein BCR41DRAFT_395910 [Lobosporangium transversale]|uniref:BRCT domain-containing protein n=1 Tax=Lobosporangium transversale TaxID=64571 RepID=A0A1Y2GQL6_9FUNG|nr:hypothetical protein BCR41DRAFT_395910 [Lobosporangium transversale]ORZ16626.1 hypothetical protein BCR41DRAFT_395910 [Lobosporangium transversale]|eukprot:XP_021881561.1 hypothetical protein BCR41DRAFT_395910 [Lobosporangium transversale]